jgi:hypothetical protein
VFGGSSNEPIEYKQDKNNDTILINRKYPFDLMFTRYIFMNESSYDVRLKALQVLIKTFNQRDMLVKELARTDIIVSKEDHSLYYGFLQK